MKRIVLAVTGILLVACAVASASDAPAAAPKGVQNSKKAAQTRMEKYKKVQEVKKRAHAQRENAQRKANHENAQ